MVDKKRFQEILKEMIIIKEKLKLLAKEAEKCCGHSHFHKWENIDYWKKRYTVTYICLKCGKRFHFNKIQPQFESKVKQDSWFGWPFENLRY